TRAALATLSLPNATIQESGVRPVYFAKTAILRPAYVVDLMLAQGTDARAYRRVVAADDGSVLEQTELTQDAAFTYRVWADATRRPLDGPNADFTPHPTGMPDGSKPSPIASSLIAMDSFNLPLDSWLASAATVS